MKVTCSAVFRGLPPEMSVDQSLMTLAVEVNDAQTFEGAERRMFYLLTERS